MDPLSISASVLTIGTVALQSTVALHSIICSFRNQTKDARALKSEVSDLAAVLTSLLETLAQNPELDLRPIELPLQRCRNVCDEYRQLIERCTKHSNDSSPSIRDWTKKKYLRGDINDFRSMLAAYKSTINIALVNANLRITPISPGVLESYNDLIVDTTSTLNNRMQDIQQKMERLEKEGNTAMNNVALERQAMLGEKASTQQGLYNCARLSQQMVQFEVASKELPSLSGQSFTQNHRRMEVDEESSANDPSSQKGPKTAAALVSGSTKNNSVGSTIPDSAGTSPEMEDGTSLLATHSKEPIVTFCTTVRCEDYHDNADMVSQTDSNDGSDGLLSRHSASTVPTEAEIGITNLGTIYRTFTGLVLHDEIIVQALEAASRTESPVAQGCRIRCILRQFVNSLQAELEGKDSEMACLFRGRTQAFASEIVRESQLRASEKDLSNSAADSKFETQLASTLAEIEHSEDGEVYSDDGGTLHTEFIDPAKFLSIVGKSASLIDFLDQIYDYGFPSLTTRLLNLQTRLRQSEPETDRILSELVYAMPSILRVSTVQPGLIDKLKCQIETVSGESWDWWPLAPLRKEMSEKQVTIEWQCRCGRSKTEVVARRFGKALESVITSAAADLANTPCRTAPGNPSADMPPPAQNQQGGQGKSSSSKRSAKQSRQQGWLLFRKDKEQPQVSKKQTNNPPTSKQDTQIQPTVIRRAIFFMVDNASIMPWNSRLGKSVIATKHLCDERFYYNMRWEFWKHRGWMKSLFSLYTFAGCDFHQFERYSRDKYHEASEGVPDSDDYVYLKRKLKPQVCREEFRDGYWNWRNGCKTQQCPTRSVIARIPKKKLNHDDKNQDPDGDTLNVIWGIVARTQRAFYMAIVYITIAASPLIPATWFFFKWLSPPADSMDEYQLANHRDNLSNAFVPLGIAIALLLATITCVFSKFD